MNNFKNIIRDVFTGVLYFIIVYFLLSVIFGLIISFVRFDFNFFKYEIFLFLTPEKNLFEILRFRIFIVSLTLILTFRSFITTEKK